MHNNNPRSSSHKQLKTLQSQLQTTPILKSIEQLKTEGIHYYYHQGYERKALHKIFTLNTKKRHIQRYINQQVYNADLNGISLKASQMDRFNLYQKGLTDELQANSKSYTNLSRLKKGDFQNNSTEQLYGLKNSQHRETRITSGLRIQSIQQETNLNGQNNQNKFSISKHLVRPKREEQLVQAIKKDNLFTIVYKSNIFSN
ncbi:unnamed protein product [Paramecium sonneborni]|uniref:Uncharacterized protein n=1 Tax=Paramecium sonneborni TaxID=65129 RepID=A0A8S1KRZ4_9CILI|nr:unnamed protein product [Paramecium sonneborni]